MAFIEQLNQLDHQFFLFLNGFHNLFFDYLMTVFTSEAFWVPFYVIAGFVMAKKYGIKSIIIFVSIGILILCTDQFAGLFKHSIQRLRPSHDPLLSQLTHIFYNKGGLYSFYSAHSSNAFAFATFTILLFKNKAYTWLFILPWALLVAYTRIYLGLHYPGDILCGALAGVAIAFGIYKLMIFTQKKYFPADNLNIPFSNKEISLIHVSVLLMIIIALIIVNVLLKNGLVITNP